MRKLEASEWLGGPRLEVIQAGGGGLSNFTLKVKQTWKKKEGEEE